MNRSSRGFGLIELLIALALSLVVVLGVVQVFIAAKNTYVSQNAAAAMQEDARFVLSKMIQEIRMVGMFGCLGTITDSSTGGSFAASQITPISWDNANARAINNSISPKPLLDRLMGLPPGRPWRDWSRQSCGASWRYWRRASHPR